MLIVPDLFGNITEGFNNWFLCVKTDEWFYVDIATPH